MDYTTYMQSPEWRKVRDRALEFWKCRCCICFGLDQVEVHHRTYERLGHEWLSDVVCLCKPCHALFHDNLSLHKQPMFIHQLQAIADINEKGIRY